MYRFIFIILLALMIFMPWGTSITEGQPPDVAGVLCEDNTLPAVYALSKNYPNPFNMDAADYVLTPNMTASLIVYDYDVDSRTADSKSMDATTILDACYETTSTDILVLLEHEHWPGAVKSGRHDDCLTLADTKEPSICDIYFYRMSFSKIEKMTLNG